MFLAWKGWSSARVYASYISFPSILDEWMQVMFVERNKYCRKSLDSTQWAFLYIVNVDNVFHRHRISSYSSSDAKMLTTSTTPFKSMFHSLVSTKSVHSHVAVASKASAQNCSSSCLEIQGYFGMVMRRPGMKKRFLTAQALFRLSRIYSACPNQPRKAFRFRQ